jgi:Mg-chelatase subunit ChlD
MGMRFARRGRRSRPDPPRITRRRPGTTLALLLFACCAPTPVPLVQAGDGAAASLPASYALEQQWQLPDRAFDPAIEPLDLAFGPEGRLYVADARNRAILAFDAAGQRGELWTSEPVPGLPAGCRALPRALAARPDAGFLHLLWEGTAGASGSRLLETRAPDGRVLARRETQAVDLALGPTGEALWLMFRDAEQSRVLRWPDPLAPQPVVDLDIALTGVSGEAGSLAVGEDSIALIGNDGSLRRYGPRAGAWRLLRRLWPEDRRLRSVVAAGAGWLALAAADPASGPEQGLVYGLDLDGEMRETFSAEALGLSLLPDLAWPFALARTPDALALVGGGPGGLDDGRPRFLLRRLALPGLVGDSLIGGPLRAGPGSAGCPPSPRMALASHPDGGVLVLDGPASQLSRIEADLSRAPRVLAPLPVAARDLALGPDGRIFLSSMDDRILSLAADGADGGLAWACDCPLGGRLALDTGGLYVTRSGERRVAAFDPRTGARRPDQDALLPLAAGLWPADLAALPETSSIWTADTLRHSLRAWQGGVAGESWPAGFRAGPKRIAAGRLPDGRPGLALLHEDNSVTLQARDGGALLALWRPDSDGARLEDLALDEEGRIYLIEDGRRRVLRLTPAEERPRPASDLPPISDRACRLQARQWVEPAELHLGQRARVTLRLDQACPRNPDRIGADLLLVLDRSASMAGAPMVEAKRAVRAFADALDPAPHQLGLVAFNDRIGATQVLTVSFGTVVAAVDELKAEGGTDIAAGLRAAGQIFGESRRPDADPMILLLTDGRSTEGSEDPRSALAAISLGLDPKLYAIGLGPNADAGLLAELAGGRYFAASSPAALTPIFEEIARTIQLGLNGNLRLDLGFHAALALVPGSLQPPAFEAPGRLGWGAVQIPEAGSNLVFEIEARQVGEHRLLAESHIAYEDPDGHARGLQPNQPLVRVVEAPVASEPDRRLWLPWLQRGPACARPGRPFDAVLLVDSSGSMGEILGGRRKIDWAIEGVAAFAAASRRESGDRLSLLSFDAAASRLADLDSPNGAFDAALAGLSPRPGAGGSRIDLGLSEARRMLLDAGRSEARKAILLLGDGRVEQSHLRRAIDLAGQARGEGMLVFAAGIGIEQDLGALEGLTGSADRMAYSADGRRLEAILRRFARELACLP